MSDDLQSTLTDDTLVCGDCAHSGQIGPRLIKNGRTVETLVTRESFECPHCGTTGAVEQRHGSVVVSRHGCVTTPQLLAYESVRTRAQSGGR